MSFGKAAQGDPQGTEEATGSSGYEGNVPESAKTLRVEVRHKA